MKWIETKYIEIKDTYLKRAQNNTVNYLLTLEPERFLYEVYRVSGLKPLAKSGYSGWERGHDANFRGHFFGHYISALALAYSAEKEAERKEQLHAKLKLSIDGLFAAQESYAEKHPESAGYISAFEEVVLDWVEVGVPENAEDKVMVPWYDLHKILAGLLEAYTQLMDEDLELAMCALQVASRFGDYVYQRIQRIENRGALLKTEYGGMNDALYNLYEISGKENFRIAAECFDEVQLFSQLMEGNDVLPGAHGNTMIPKFIGASKRCLIQEKKGVADEGRYWLYKKGATNFWKTVVTEHSFVTGGNTQREHFREAGQQYYDSWVREGYCTCETCNAHNMLKLTRNLYQMEGKPEYLDYYEQTFINSILASQNPETGMMMYFQPMGAGYNKVYNRPYDEFWCCTGTGIESFSKLSDSFYYLEEDVLHLNLYFSNELILADYNLKLSIDMERKKGLLRIKAIALDEKKPVKKLWLALRKPSWAPKVTLFDSSKGTWDEKEGFLYSSSVCSSGYSAEAVFSMEMRGHEAKDNENYVAFTYGPYVLAGRLGDYRVGEDQPIGILVRAATKDTSAPELLTTIEDTKQWKQMLNVNAQFMETEDNLFTVRLKGILEDIVFVPYYELHESRYGIYFKLAQKESPEELMHLEQKLTMQEEKDSQYGCLDNFDHNNAELEKNLQFEKSSIGVYWNRSFRMAEPGGWFGYDFRVDEEAEEIYLQLTFHGDDHGKDILLKINEQNHNILIPESKEGFYDVTFGIQGSGIHNKGIIHLEFFAIEKESCRLFGIKLLKKENQVQEH